MEIKKPPLAQTGTVGKTAPIAKVETHDVKGTAQPVAVEPPAPKAGKHEPFVGHVIAAQIGRISMLKGTDPEGGNVAWTRKLSDTDKFNKVGIFFEAEAKLTLVDDADGASVKARVLEAGDSGKLAGLLPKNSPFANLTMKWDRANSRSGADFHDVYGDDAKMSLAKAKAQLRERRIGDTQDGKFESKLPAVAIQGSAVLGRIECAYSTGPTRRPKQDILDEAIKVIDDMNAKGLKTPEARSEYAATLTQSQKENPLVLVGVEVPDFNPRTFTDKIKIDDIRHQLVIQDHTGKDMFLLTLDFVHATRLDSGKEGDFVEFEIERMDGSTTKAGLSELIELTNAVAKALDLTKSPAPKNARGMTVTE